MRRKSRKSERGRRPKKLQENSERPKNRLSVSVRKLRKPRE